MRRQRDSEDKERKRGRTPSRRAWLDAVLGVLRPAGDGRGFRHPLFLTTDKNSRRESPPVMRSDEVLNLSTGTIP